ncbi:hypothetical protein [Paenibacillus sp. A3M_27_13]|uniref:hypothetical protein n=1 Tax=Paenibacillus sp. A3M_27_13 TaxID=2962029 RepID=UPI0020B800BA|nr:hypothetical protein [Paenibacillus sp. A3M_27_13]MCP3746809.1 hypothetical protein [Paenibacillus sp. A3M_27_13]
MDSCESSSEYSYAEYDTEYKSLQKYHSENPFVRNLITERLYELRILLKQHITREKQDYTVYALKLEHDCFYVGTSTQIDKRIKNHWKGKGAVWTQLHRPKELVRKLPLGVCDFPTAEHAENLMTIEFMRLYGWNRVRGGFFCQTDENSTLHALQAHVERFNIDFLPSIKQQLPVSKKTKWRQVNVECSIASYCGNVLGRMTLEQIQSVTVNELYTDWLQRLERRYGQQYVNYDDACQKFETLLQKRLKNK